MKTQFYERHRYLILGVAACLAPLVWLGATRAMRTNANDVRTWLPRGLPEAVEYARFGQQFGTEEFVVVSWPGCTLDDPRLERLADRLASPPTIAEPSGQAPLVAEVLIGPRALDRLTSPPINLSRDAAIARLRGFAIGPDGRQTCAVVRPTERAKRNPQSLLQLIDRAAMACGVPRGELRMGGPLVTSVAVDEAANSSLSTLGLLSIAAAIVISWTFFRSLRLTLMVVAVAIFAAAAALAAVSISGGEMNAVLVSMPPLVYVATMSGAIHWANYYRDAVLDGGLAGAVERAVAQARLPLGLATGTTALGLLSLCGSDLLPIRQFGLYSAVGVAASLAWLLFLLPAACAVWPLRLPHRVPQGESGEVPNGNGWWWGEHITGRPALVTTVVLALVAPCWFGLSWLKTSVTAESFFADDARYPQHSRWLEQQLGGTVPVELVVRMERGCPLSMLERMELIDRVQRNVASLEGTGTSVSAVTFSPQIPRRTDERWSLKRSVLNRRLEKHRDELLQSGFLAVADGAELWRISLRAKSFGNVDQRYFMDEALRQIEPVLGPHRGPDGISATITGMAPLIERAQHSLLEGLLFGLAIDLALIVITVVVLVRHWSVGLALLLASMVPVLTLLGLMGWLGIALDVGSVLAPSVALGVTVDDVLHFVLWFRRGLAKGLNCQQSIRLAYDGCARAMYQSWGVIGVGLGVFALSDFAPTRRFGLLMISLLTVGLLVNLVLLPALLAGPLGKFLARSVQRANDASGRSGEALHTATASRHAQGCSVPGNSLFQAGTVVSQGARHHELNRPDDLRPLATIP